MKLYTTEERTAERFGRSCKGKRSWPTEAEAHAEQKRLRKQFKMRMKAYHCIEFCGQYHLGHNRTGSKRLYLELNELVAYQKQYGY